MKSNLDSGENQIIKSGLYFEGNEPPLKVLSMKDMTKAVLKGILVSQTCKKY